MYAFPHRHLRFFPYKRLQIQAVEIDTALLGLEASSSDHVHFVPHRYSLVFVSRRRFPSGSHELFPTVRANVVLEKVVRVMQPRRAAKQEQIVPVRAHALPVKFARSFLRVREYARPGPRACVVLHHVRSKAIHFHTRPACYDDGARGWTLTHPEGSAGVNRIAFRNCALPTMKLEIEHVHIVETRDLILVPPATSKEIRLLHVQHTSMREKQGFLFGTLLFTGGYTRFCALGNTSECKQFYFRIDLQLQRFLEFQSDGVNKVV